MRIGVNTLFLIPREVGGSETILCETLSEIIQHFPEIKLHLFTNLENDEFLKSLFPSSERIRYTCLNFNARNRFTRIFREQCELPSIADKTDIDLLWSPGYTAPFQCQKPQAVSVLDVQYKTHPEDLNLLSRFATDFLVKGASRRSGMVLTLSEFSKSEIMKYYGVSADRIRVTFCGVNPEFARAYSKEEQNRILGEILPDIKTPYILCVANSYPHKNVHVLAKAFSKLTNEIPHRLVIVGQARRGEPELEKMMSEIPKGRVVRLQHFYKPQLVPLYQGADLFVLPSLYEGFGLPLAEAMMAKVPVVTTRMASIPEVCGDTAVYFEAGNAADLADKIKQALSLNQQEKASRIERAKTRAGGLTWQNSTKKLVAAFKELIGDGPVGDRPNR